jgi:hypothetical protein
MLLKCFRAHCQHRHVELNGSLSFQQIAGFVAKPQLLEWARVEAQWLAIAVFLQPRGEIMAWWRASIYGS